MSINYTVVGASADLAIAMVGNVLVKTGTNMTYYIALANLGPNAANNVTITDTIPTGTTFVSSGYGIESCKIINGWPNCSFMPTTNSCGSVQGKCSIGSLAAWTNKNPIGALIQVTVKVNAAKGTNIKNTAVVSESNTDPNSNNNTAIWYTSVTK